ncbi:MAG: hypothetical protein V1934_07810 [Methanobacteriota archaeon]
MTKCSKCGSDMTFYEPAKDWYCYGCNAYSRYNIPYGVPVDSVSKRSILRVMALIVGLLGIISILLFLFGLGQINQAMIHYDYDYYYDDSNRVEAMLKGTMNIGIATGLLIVSYIGMRSTLSKKSWWERMHKYVDTSGNDPWANVMIKNQLVEIFQVYYGVIIMSGVVFLGIGIFFLNMFDTGGLYAVAGLEAMLGAFLILTSYIAYGKEMVRLSRDVYPLLMSQTEPAPSETKFKS